MWCTQSVLNSKYRIFAWYYSSKQGQDRPVKEKEIDKWSIGERNKERKGSGRLQWRGGNNPFSKAKSQDGSREIKSVPTTLYKTTKFNPFIYGVSKVSFTYVLSKKKSIKEMIKLGGWARWPGNKRSDNYTLITNNLWEPKKCSCTLSEKIPFKYVRNEEMLNFCEMEMDSFQWGWDKQENQMLKVVGRWFVRDTNGWAYHWWNRVNTMPKGSS